MIMPCEANFIEIFTSIFDVNKNYILTCSCAVSPVKFRALALLTVQLTIEFSAASCQSIRWLNSTVEGLIFVGVRHGVFLCITLVTKRVFTLFHFETV